VETSGNAQQADAQRAVSLTRLELWMPCDNASQFDAARDAFVAILSLASQSGVQIKRLCRPDGNFSTVTRTVLPYALPTGQFISPRFIVYSAECRFSTSVGSPLVNLVLSLNSVINSAYAARGVGILMSPAAVVCIPIHRYFDKKRLPALSQAP
jgi:hypothetical protein